MPDAAWPRFWRVFPWDLAAEPGAPFSSRYVVPAERQQHGRFDLGTSPVLYLTESPEHAVAELLRPFTGRPLTAAQLSGAGHPLALVEVRLDPGIASRVADLTDPLILARYAIRPDALASRNRTLTQSLSRALFDRGLPGFRWWSALHGDWHAALLFLGRIAEGELAYGDPDPLTTSHPAVRAAATELMMDLP
jgi:hypothetical protein